MNQSDKPWEDFLIYKVIAGSHCYGTNDENSDVDFRGICLPSKNNLLGFNKFEQKLFKEQDEQIFSLDKFLKLALDGNPNIIELLFIEDDYILYKNSKYMDKILEKRQDFLSKQSASKFFYYAVAQIKRMEAHHKWLIDPPKKPNCFDFGAILGVNGVVIWPKDANKNGYDNKKRDYKNYKTWIENRNEKRFELEKKFFYDTKFAMHAVRLLMSSIKILKDYKNYKSRFSEDEVEYLKNVKTGLYKYEELVGVLDTYQKEFEEEKEKSNLRQKANYTEGEAILIEIYEDFLVNGFAISE